MTNLLDPLTFVEGEISLFIRDHSCGLCGGYLYAKHAPGRKYTAHCPEHGAIYGHNHVKKFKGDQAKQGIIDGRHELRDDPEPRDEADILKELGF